MFGSPAPATSGLFGAAGKPGTLQVPYSDSRVNDGTTQINFKSISAMTAYDKKSFEELRLEDYMAGNKGGQGQNIGANTFGAQAPAPAGGLFGAAPATSTFGSPAPAPAAFGAPAPSAFGAVSAPSGGLFGAPNLVQAPSAFGAPAPSAFSAPAPAPAGGLFGAPAPAPAAGGLFGAPAPAPAANGFSFGASPAPAPAGFGSTAAPVTSGGLFGAPAPAPSAGLFGAPAPAPSGGLFGSTPAPSTGLFGAPAAAPAASGLFGAPAPAPSTGLFGAPAPAAGGMFGAPAPTPSAGLFGAPATGGMFGAPAPATGGLFGAPAPVPAAGGMFGSTAPAFGMAPNTSFGATTAPMAVANPATTTVIVPPSADTLLSQQLAAVETQKKEMAVLEALHGASPATGSATGYVIPSTIFQRDAAAVKYSGLAINSISRSPLSYPQQMIPRSTTKVRPRGFGPPIQSTSRITNSHRKATTMTPSAFVGSSTKHLVIKPGSLTPKPTIKLMLTEESFLKSKHNEEKEDGLGNVMSPSSNSRFVNGYSETPASQKSRPLSANKPSPFDVSRIANEEVAFTSPEVTTTKQPVTTKSPQLSSIKKKATPHANEEAYDYYQSVIGSPTTQTQDNNEPSINLLPKLTKDGYVISPSMHTLSTMSESELASVTNFSIERVGIGSIAWDGAVDIRGVDLDAIITIKPKDVSVYEKQEELGTKPMEGSKLNRPAIITFHEVFPKDGPGASAEAKKKLDQKIQKHTKKMGSELIMYDSEKGIWMFRVPHFSRYVFDEDSDEDDSKGDDIAPRQVKPSEDFDSGADGGSAPANNWEVEEKHREQKRAKLSNLSDELVEYKETSHPEGSDWHQSYAEAAYEKLGAEINDLDMYEEQEKEIQIYDDEGESNYDSGTNKPLPIVFASEVKSSFSICDQIAKKSDSISKTSSSTDYSLRFGGSFAIGWQKSGSFLAPQVSDGKQSRKLVELTPFLASSGKVSTKLLISHLEHSAQIYKDDVPIFCIPSNNESKFKVLSAYQDICNNEILRENDNLPCKVISQAFSLISVLFGPKKVSQSLNFGVWLKEVCKDGVEREISAADESNNVYSSIFAALSGSDGCKASTIALNKGLFNLSVVIANTSMSSNYALVNQINEWDESSSSQFIPPYLVRIFSFLSGDLGLEESIYKNSAHLIEKCLNWTRRLSMLYKCMDEDLEESELLTFLFKKYKLDVKDGKAPPPYPWYSGNHKNEECILYRLMKLFLNDETSMCKLSQTISPNGYTSKLHDVTFSFHLAAILSSMEVSCEPLSEVDECRLLESYALILIQSGRWEWAVYVLLCTFKQHTISKSSTAWKKRMVTDIICKYYSDSVEFKSKRKFLETKIGIPSEWFDVPSFFRSSNNSFHYESVTRRFISNNSMSKIISTIEDTIVPKVVFNGDEECCNNLINMEDKLNESGNSFGTSLCGLAVNYAKIRKALFRCEELDIDDLCQQSHLIKQSLQILQQRNSSNDDFVEIPRPIILAEFENAVTLLIMNLNILKHKGSKRETLGLGLNDNLTQAHKLAPFHEGNEIRGKTGIVLRNKV